MTEPASTEAEAADSTTIPLFPLGLVLFPGGQLPLKVFEQRYVEMTKSCLRNDSPFGVCLIRHGREVGEPADHETIGCSARITNWEMPHPGLFHLLCSGERVFRVSRTHIEHKSLIVGDVQWLDCKSNPEGTYELHDGQPGGYSWHDVIDTMAGLRHGKPVAAIKIPLVVVKLFSALNLITARAIGYAPMLTPGKVRELRHFDWGNEHHQSCFELDRKPNRWWWQPESKQNWNH